MNISQALKLTQLDGQSARQARFTLSIISMLHFASAALIAPYLNLYLKTSGLTATQIGLLVSLASLLELSLNPLANSFADTRGKHRLLVQLQMTLMTSAIFIICLTTNSWLLGLGYVLYAINARGSNEMLSQLTMTRLSDFGLRIFGKVRLWGSVGWAGASIIGMQIVALGSYPLSFLVAGMVRLMLFPFINGLPEKTGSKPAQRLTLPFNKAVYIMLITQFIFFIGLNGWSQFIWIHFREGLSVAPEHIGILAAWYAVTEFIPLRYVDQIVERFGVRKVMITGMFGMAFEWLAYAFLPNFWWVGVMAVLRAMFFTMYTVAGTLIISDISHPNRVATNRALIHVTMPALAILISSPFVGWIYDNFGHLALFSFSSAAGLIACFFILSQYKRLIPAPSAELEQAAV